MMDDFIEMVVAIIGGAALLVGMSVALAVAIKVIRALWIWCLA